MLDEIRNLSGRHKSSAAENPRQANIAMKLAISYWLFNLCALHKYWYEHS